MMVFVLASAVLLFGQEAAADAPAPGCDPVMQVCPVIDPATGQPRQYPADVVRFQADVEACLHFAGEEPYDAARRREIEAAVRKHCDGSAARLPKLRRKYAADPVNLNRVEQIQAFRVEAGL
ncbi:MAG TPA: hypothetical protein VEA44_00170 [Caulobacter sp.]|nr:hypothetical protein [Caulobacter sp.]